MAIYYVCPDTNQPLGGIKVLYRHVDILSEAGYDAHILHTKDGFRCNWFKNNTSIRYLSKVEISSQDTLVLSENAVLGQFKTVKPFEVLWRKYLGKYKYKHFISALWALPARRIVFNQNAYYTFDGWPQAVTQAVANSLYKKVSAIMTVSQDSSTYLSKIFDTIKPVVISPSVNTDIFKDVSFSQKQKKIAYMPRKNAEHFGRLFPLLDLTDWQLVALDNMDEATVANHLKSSALFLAMGYPEGLQLPPIEAMLSSCYVVGYHGQGCKDTMLPHFSSPIEFGDLQGFAQGIHNAMNLFESDKAQYESKTKLAQAHCFQHFSPAKEKEALLQFWQKQ